MAHGNHEDGDGPREGGRLDEWDVAPVEGTSDGKKGGEPSPRQNRGGGLNKKDAAIVAVILVLLLAIAMDWVDWRIGFAVFIPILGVLIAAGGVIALLGKGGGHGENNGDSHAGGHGEGAGGHGHKAFLTKLAQPFVVRLLKPDQQVIWTNRLTAERGGRGEQGEEERNPEGWFTEQSESWLTWGRVAFGVPLWREPAYVVDTSAQEKVFDLIANPGGEAMDVKLRVVVEVSQDKSGHLKPDAARRLVTALDKEPWEAIEDRAQSAFNDALGRLGIVDSLQVVPSPDNEGVARENWGRIEGVLRDPETNEGILQEELDEIGFFLKHVQIQFTRAAAAEQAREAHVRKIGGINPNVGLVVDAVKDLAAALGGRGGKSGHGKSSGGRGGRGRPGHGHSVDDEDEE